MDVMDVHCLRVYAHKDYTLTFFYLSKLSVANWNLLESWESRVLQTEQRTASELLVVARRLIVRSIKIKEDFVVDTKHSSKTPIFP
jgi:hypothetical protein